MAPSLPGLRVRAGVSVRSSQLMRVLALIFGALSALASSPVLAQAPAPPPAAGAAAAQGPDASAPALDLPATICGQTVAPPSRLPPPGGPYVTAVMLCFEKQGGSPVVEANTYLTLHLEEAASSGTGRVRRSGAATGVGDFKRLWARTSSTTRHRGPRCLRNGVLASGRLHMEERHASRLSTTWARIKSSRRKSTGVKSGPTILLDSFMTQALLRVSGVVRELSARRLESRV